MSIGPLSPDMMMMTRYTTWKKKFENETSRNNITKIFFNNLTLYYSFKSNVVYVRFQFVTSVISGRSAKDLCLNFDKVPQGAAHK